MEINPQHTLGFLAGGYKNVAQFKGLPPHHLPEPTRKSALSSLLVGWDAADWQVIQPLAQRGALPHFVEWMHGAKRSNLATLDPPISPMLWTSIATGQWPSAHGIHGFTEMHEGTVRAVRGTSIQVPTYWDYLEAAGVPSTVVGWWPSHPAQPSALGAPRISNLAAAENGQWLDQGCWPPHLKEVARQLLLKPEELPAAVVAAFFPGMELTSEDDLVRSVLKITTHALNVHTLATLALDHAPGGHASLYYDALDHYMHVGMRYHPPQLEGVSDVNFARYRHIVTAAYQLHDLFLQSLSAATDQGTKLWLISDHGFRSGSDRLPVLPNHAGAPALEHRHFGVFLTKGPHVRSEQRPSGLTLLDLAPMVLAAHGIKAPTDMVGTVPAWMASGQNKVNISKVQPQALKPERGPELDEAVLQRLVDLGYLEERDTRSQQGRLLENSYYLARSLRAEGRPKEAYETLRPLLDSEEVVERYAQLAASLLAETGQWEELATLLELWKDRAKVAYLWRYFEQLLRLQRGESLQIPDGLWEQGRVFPADVALLWGRLLARAGHWSSLNKLLDVHAADRPDWWNLRLRYYLHQEAWEKVLDCGLRSTEWVYHQPAIHGAMARALHHLGQAEAAKMAYAVARSQMPATEGPPLYIVTGPPRSGTSLAMQLLEALGIVPVSDGVRRADDFNQGGYYEHERVRTWSMDASWLARQRGKAIKMVEPLFAQAPLPAGPKVVLRMNRPLEQVLQSQRRLMRRPDQPLGFYEPAQWEAEAKRARELAATDPSITWVEVDFRTLLSAADSGPGSEGLEELLAKLTRALGKPVDKSTVARVVQPNWRHF